MILSLVMVVAPLVTFIVSLILFVRGVILGSFPIVPLVLLCACVLYVASGTWRAFSLARAQPGDR